MNDVWKVVVALVLVGGALGPAARAEFGWTPIAFTMFGEPDVPDSVAWPGADCNVAGLAFTAFGKQASVYGLQCNLWGGAEELYGFQLGLMNIVTDSGFGVQAGMLNECVGDGIQLGAFNLKNSEGFAVQVGMYNGPFMLGSRGISGYSGLQIGILNYAYWGGHVQIGLFNVADQCDWCFQIGLTCMHEPHGSSLLVGWHF